MNPLRIHRRAHHAWRPAAMVGAVSIILALAATVLPLHAQEPVFLPLIEGASLATATPTAQPTATATPSPQPGASPTARPSPQPTRATTTGGLPLIHVAPVARNDVLDEASVFWFGQVSPALNAVDVRIGYTTSELVVYVATFDRRLWHDDAPSAATLTEWDAVTLLLAGPAADAAAAPRWRIVAQMNFSATPADAQRVEQWSNGAWAPASLPVAATSGWRGEHLNDDTDDRGWVETFRISLAALGLPAQPEGAFMRMGLLVHDRDQRTGPMEATQMWPAGVNAADVATWGTLQIGAPQWQPPAAQTGGELSIRRARVADASVPDAGVGGTTGNLCGSNTPPLWEVWPNANWGREADANVQNQIDTADWPCYARYYVTFGLESLPAGKAIVGATLTLHQYGNSGAYDLAKPSYIQVLRAGGTWDEETVTWNNAPQALENVSALWVTPVKSAPPWPGIAWSWDVGKAVADAYAEGQPVRLVLYSADSNYHSGKLFVTSDTGDWNREGRPTLHVVWGEK